MNDLRVGQEALRGEMAVLRSQQVANHKQNRDSIHDLRDVLQTVVDDVGEIKLKFAKLGGYALGAGAVVGFVVTVLSKVGDHLLNAIWR